MTFRSTVHTLALATLALLATISCTAPLLAQANVAADRMSPNPDKPLASPAKHAQVTFAPGPAAIDISYNSPSIRGRKIMGNLVPYGKVWRTGANQATKLVFSTPVKLNGNDLPAGTYALFTIPNPDEWTVIVNKGPEGGNPGKYDAKDDIVRFQVKPTTLSHKVETLTIEFNEIKELTSHLNILWDKVEIPLTVEVEDFTNKLAKRIDETMSSNEPNKPYFQAAAFYYNHGLDLKKAHEWVDAALKERDAHFIAYLKAQILEKLGDKKGALEAAKHSNELAAKANDSAYVKQSSDLITKLQ
jgi:Protein of unknown function (DUF2911)